MSNVQCPKSERVNEAVVELWRIGFEKQTLDLGPWTLD